MNRACESGRQPMQNRKSVSKKSASCVNDLLYRYRPLSRAQLFIRGLVPGAYAPGFKLSPAPQATTSKTSRVSPSTLRLRVRAANERHHMFLTREAGVSIKPGVKRSGTPGTRR